MSATGSASPRAGVESGATLLEMLVVMGLLVMATGIVFPNLRRPYAALSVETTRAAVAADLRDARAQAIRTDQPVSFTVAKDGRSYGYGGGRVLLPAAARLVSDPESILFAADGSSSGARLAVLRSGGGRRLALGLDASTGVVGSHTVQ